jgi:hypothetical protein
MQVSDEKISEVAQTLWADVYEGAFRGKTRGRFCITREQLKQALDVERLHSTTVERLQDIAQRKGLIIVDLDDLFPCIEVEVVRRYRRPPNTVFARFFPEQKANDAKDDAAEDDE